MYIFTALLYSLYMQDSSPSWLKLHPKSNTPLCTIKYNTCSYTHVLQPLMRATTGADERTRITCSDIAAKRSPQWRGCG